MGRLSYDLHSRPQKGLFAQLESQGQNIIKVVLTSKTQQKNDVNTYFCQNWDQVKNVILKLKNQISEAWNLGGPGVYKVQLEDKNQPLPGKLYLTTLHTVFECDTFYPTEYITNLKSTIDSSKIH